MQINKHEPEHFSPSIDGQESRPIENQFNVVLRSFGQSPEEWITDFVQHNLPNGVILATQTGEKGTPSLLDTQYLHSDSKPVLEVDPKSWGFGVLRDAFRVEGADKLPLLSVSPGAGLTAKQVDSGLEMIRTGKYQAVSWYVGPQGNNGSAPGLMGYNYAFLYSPEAVSILRALPDDLLNMSENGVVGTSSVEVDGKTVEGPLGGGEETIYAVHIARERAKLGLETRFAHVVSNPIGVEDMKTGTGITHEWKLLRKTISAKAYLERLGVGRDEYMALWDIV